MALFALELAVSAYGWAIEKEGMDQVIKELAVKVIIAGVLFFFVNNPQLIIDPLVNGLEGSGAYIAGGAGFHAMEPAEMMDIGRQVTGRLAWALDASPPVTPGDEDAGWIESTLSTLGGIMLILPYMGHMLLFGIICLISMAVIYGAFIVIAAQMVLAKVEMYIVMSAGAFFLGFSAFRITAGLAENVVRYAASIGVKLFFIQIMAGVAQRLAPGWKQVADQMVYCPFSALACPSPVNQPWVNLSTLALLIGSIVIFAYLAWKIPGTMASRLTGDMQIGVTRALWGK